MATFSGNAAGYQIDFLANGKIRVVDIDLSDGDTGEQILSGAQSLDFADKSYQLGLQTQTTVSLNANRSEYTNPSDIATLADGSYVILWYGEGDAGYGLYTQRYDAAGNALGEVSNIHNKQGNDTAIAALDGGGYVISWTQASDIYQQRFDASGNTVGDATIVNTTTANNQDLADVAALADGGYVVVWVSDKQDGNGHGIYAQRYDASGNAVGGEIRANTTTAGNQTDPAVTALSDGSYVIVWNSSDGDIRAQHYDATGAAVGGEVDVNGATPGNFVAPYVIALAGGGYAVMWQSGNNWDNNVVHLQRYDTAGNALGGVTQVTGPDSISDMAITGLADGGFVVTWGSDQIFTQRYDAAGDAVGHATRVSTTPGFNEKVTITALDDGGYVITWINSKYDISENVLYAQHFDANGESQATGIQIDATTGNDVVNCGSGAQYIFGDAGNDVISGGLGDDTFDGGSGNDELNGGAGDDLLMGRDGMDTLRGGDGDDRMYDYDYSSTMFGGDGDDILESDRGSDTLNGGAGDDYLYSGSRNDTLQGGDGDDYLSGGYGNDRLEGGAGNDMLNGTRGSDTLLGGGGSDTLFNGKNATGGAGSDNFLINRNYLGFAPVSIKDFSVAGGDAIQLDGLAKLSALGALNPEFFAANADGVAMDADDYIVYDSNSGELYYDADGNGAGARVQLAVLVGTPALTAADIEVV